MPTMLNINFDPFPNLSTERLALRRMHDSDLDELLYLRSHLNIMKYIPRPLAATREDAYRIMKKVNDLILANEAITWGMVLKNEAGLIGTIGYVRMAKEHFRAEIGYLLHDGYQGKGLMQEALTAVINYGFGVMKLHSVEAVVDPQNAASIKLLERNEFIKEAHFKEHEFFEGRFIDSVVYSRRASIT
jgi:ribosomal-protein-alanine N-acetyltransferase